MKKSTLFTIAALAASSGMATAAFDAHFTGLTGINNAVNVSSSEPFISGDYNAGQFNFAYDGPGDRGTGQYSGGTFAGFCIELQHASSLQKTYEIGRLKDAPNPGGGAGEDPYDLTDELEVNAVVAAAISLGWINTDLSATGPTTNATRKQFAAIQGHIWRVLFDNSDVIANAVIQTEWDALLVQINANPNGRVADLRVMTNADSQDQLYIVPLPTAALAGLMTLGGLAGFKRIRRR